MSHKIEDRLNEYLKTDMKDLQEIYNNLVEISDKLPSGSEKHIFVTLRYLSNYLYNLSMHTSVTYQRISQLQDAVSSVYGKVMGEQPPISSDPAFEELKNSVGGLRERFEKTLGSLDDVIDKLNNNHRKDQEELK